MWINFYVTAYNQMVVYLKIHLKANVSYNIATSEGREDTSENH